MKKACSVIMCLILILTVQLAAFAEDMNLKTVVPDSHEITVTFNEGGYVLHSGRRMDSGDRIIVNRFDGVTLEVIAKPEAHLEAVYVNGEDVTAQMEHGKLTLENVSSDIDVNFVFCECDDPNIEEDPCVRMKLSGKVYKGDAIMPKARLEFDFGELEATADKDGAYKLDEIKDGRHTVSIYDKDGALAGEQSFAVEVSDTATQVTVVKLDDGTQIVTVPRGASELWLDFVVNADGTIDITPSGPDGDEPTPTPPAPTPEPGNDDKDIGKIIKDSPVISRTGALIKENIAAAFVLALDGLFILFFVLWRRKRRDDEDEGAKVK